jgi:hypothetical protein
MASTSLRRLAAMGSFLAMCLMTVVLALAADAPAKVMGDLWEVTSQMSMEGAPMKMPERKAKVCAPKDWTEPPGAADERQKCTTSDMRKEGDNKVLWKTVCAGPPEMTGEGEITRSGADNYTGSIKFTSAEGNMTIKLSGTRLGECELPAK